jgi:hypothetical protein
MCNVADSSWPPAQQRKGSFWSPVATLSRQGNIYPRLGAHVNRLITQTTRQTDRPASPLLSVKDDEIIVSLLSPRELFETFYVKNRSDIPQVPWRSMSCPQWRSTTHLNGTCPSVMRSDFGTWKRSDRDISSDPQRRPRRSLTNSEDMRAGGAGLLTHQATHEIHHGRHLIYQWGASESLRQTEGRPWVREISGDRVGIRRRVGEFIFENP